MPSIVSSDGPFTNQNLAHWVNIKPSQDCRIGFTLCPTPLYVAFAMIIVHSETCCSVKRVARIDLDNLTDVGGRKCRSLS